MLYSNDRIAIYCINALTGRSGELVETLGERRIDIACVQEIRWRGSSCRYFGATGKRYKLFWMGSEAKTEGVGIFVSEKLECRKAQLENSGTEDGLR